MNKKPQMPPNGIPLRPPLRAPIRQLRSVETTMLSNDDAEKGVTRVGRVPGRRPRAGPLLGRPAPIEVATLDHRGLDQAVTRPVGKLKASRTGCNGVAER